MLRLMEEQKINKDTQVSELFNDWPALVSYFLDQKLGCVGCSLVLFCTVEDVVNAYELDCNEFIQALNNYVQALDEEK